MPHTSAQCSGLNLNPIPHASVRTADQVSWPPPRARGRPTAQVSPPTLCPRKTDPPEAWVRATGPSRILPRLLLPSQLSLPTSPPPDHPPPHLPGLSGLLLFSFLLSANTFSKGLPSPGQPIICSHHFPLGFSFPKLAPPPRIMPRPQGIL